MMIDQDRVRPIFGTVTELGYVGIGVKDLDAWRSYATAIVGMEARESGPQEFQLRMDIWHHRITVQQDDSDDLLYLGWRVADADSLEEVAARLTHAGVLWERGSDDLAEKRNVLGLIQLTDPAGAGTEIFFGPEIEVARPFHPGRPLHGKFLTGEKGIGHCFMHQSRIPDAVDFYKLLGMRGGVQYKIRRPGELDRVPVFMTSGRRHHAVAFGEGYFGPKRINHMMFEYTHLDDLGAAFDLAQERGIRFVRNLGRHSNDQVLSFYMVNPSGWVWELGWGEREPPEQEEYFRTNYFGFQSPA